MEKEWVTVREAADKTGYTTEYVRDLARKGAIISKKFGPLHQINLESLLQHKAAKDEWRAQRGGE